jgi:four helix bundle protein
MNKYSKPNPTYDLEERTMVFSENIIALSKCIERSISMNPLVDQLVRSATSIGANYSEANGASSRKDFTNKISICKKEAKETLYWLRLIGKSTIHPTIKDKCREMWIEDHELVLIFATISNKLRIK